MKKVFKYLITLVIVFVITMATTINLLSPNTANYLGASQVADGSGGSQAMGKLLKYFQSLNSFEVSGAINFSSTSESENNSISKVSDLSVEPCVEYEVSADISNLASAKVEATVKYIDASQIVVTKITYLNGDLYVNMQNTCVKVENATIEEVVGLILSSLNTEGFDASSLLNQFDIGSIMAALGQMKEIQNDDNTITNILVLPEIASVDIITDNEYELKSLNIYDIKLIDIPLEMSVDINKTVVCDVSEPENSSEYLNVTTWANSVKNTLSLNQICVNPVLNFKLANGKTVSAEFNFAKTANGSIFTTLDVNSFGFSARLIIENGKVYANIQDVNVCFKVESLKTLLNNLLTNFADAHKEEAEQVSNEINNMLNSATQFDFKSAISDCLSRTSVAELLSSVSDFNLTSSTASFGIDFSKIGFLNLNTKVSLQVGIDEQKEQLSFVDFSAINICGNDVNLSVNITDEIQNLPEVIETEYLSIDEVWEAVVTLKDVREGEFAISATLSQNGKTYQNINLNAGLSVQANLLFNVTLSLAGNENFNANVIFKDNIAYIKTCGVNAKFNLNEIDDLLLALGLNPASIRNSLTEKINNSDEDFNSILDKLEDFGIATSEIRELKERLFALNIEKVIRSLKSVKTSSTEIEIVLDKSLLSGQEDIVLIISFANNNVSGITLNNFPLSSERAISLNIVVNPCEVNEPVIIDEEYLDLTQVAINTINLKDFSSLKANVVATMFEGNSGIYQLIASLDLGLDNGKFTSLSDKILSLLNGGYVNLSANLGGLQELNANVVLFNNELYINLNNNYIKIGKEDALSLVGITNDELNNLIETSLNNLTSGMPNIEVRENITLASILSLLGNFNIETSSDCIKLSINGSLLGQAGTLEIVIELVNNSISKITVNNLKVAENKTINFEITLDTISEIEKFSPSDNYFDLVDGYNSLLNMLSLKALSVDIQAGLFESDLANTGDFAFGTDKYSSSFDMVLEKISDPTARTLDLYTAIQTYNMENNLDLDINYKDDVLYVSYKTDLGNAPLKLKISKENINASVLAICELLISNDEQIEAVSSALDSAQAFMEGAGVESIINLNQLSLLNLISSITSNSQLQESKGMSFEEVVNIIKGISINAQEFNVSLPESFIGTSSPLRFGVTFNMGEVDTINLYGFDCNLIADYVSGLGIDVTDKKLDVSVKVTPNCTSVTDVQGDYINLNGVDEIIKSASNALKENKGFTLSGKVNAGLVLSGKEYNIDDVQVNVTANLGENGLELLIDLPSIPVLFPGIVFKAATMGRNAKIYYNNGMVYIYRFDDQLINKNDKTYKYSCTTEWCFANFAEVLGYALGFTDTIVEQIDKGINSVDEKAPACVIENILEDFSAQSTNSTSNYSIKFSGSALAQNTMLGDMIALIKTNNQTHTIEQIGIDMVFVNFISLNGMLDFMAYPNAINITYDTTGYEFKG